MIRATIDHAGGIRICADAASALVAAKLPGATRNAKMPIRQWNMPFTMETIGILREVPADFTPELAAAAERLEKTMEFVERQKAASEVAPLAAVPLKDGCRLYMHQVKAFNITLALLGYDTPNDNTRQERIRCSR